MLAELLRHIEERIVPLPSAGFNDFIRHARQGDNTQIPSFGRPALFDYYGINKKG